MHPEVVAAKAEAREVAAQRDPRVRHLWIYLTDRECAALVATGVVSRRLRREFNTLLNGWKRHQRK